MPKMRGLVSHLKYVMVADAMNLHRLFSFTAVLLRLILRG
jgi:hypothetical protein